jgi:RHS repeat-associated protein
LLPRDAGAGSNYTFLTHKERDNETGLDFFGARYYGSTQGRFISPDPLLSSGHLENPQTWNRYPYTLNNPLALVDPTGLFSFGSNLSDEERKKITDAYNNLKASLGKLEQGSKAYKSIERSLARLGEPGKANGVVVTVGSVKFSGGSDTDVNSINKGTVTIKFDEKSFSNSSAEDDAANLGHEGVHADDAFNLFSQLRKNMGAFAKAWESNDVTYRTEYDAYFASAGVYQALQPDQLRSYGNYVIPTAPGMAEMPTIRFDLWNPSWQRIDIKEIESKQGFTIQTKLEAPQESKIRGYGLKRPANFQP